MVNAVCRLGAENGLLDVSAVTDRCGENRIGILLMDATYHIGGALAVFSNRKCASAEISYSLTGKLYFSRSGYLLLSVPNALGRGAFDALNEPGIELPVSESLGRYNAHITVLSPEEVEGLGGPQNITERGHEFTYTLGPLRSTIPSGWEEMGRVWFIEIKSPDLEKLRKSYGLTPLPKDIPFHATIAVRRRHVLKHNPIVKLRRRYLEHLKVAHPIRIKHASDDRPPTIAIDLDGTLADYEVWKGGDHFGDPRPGAVQGMKKLKEKGYKLIIHTCRGNESAVKTWLDENKIPFDAINKSIDPPPGNSTKPLADAYVDDKGIRADKHWDLLVDEIIELVEKEKAASVIDDMREAKAHSDVKNYGAKHKIMRRIISERPHEFAIDSEEKGVVGITHRSGFKMHLPKRVVPGVLTQKAAGLADKLKEERARINHSPTPGQIEAGNYKMGHIRMFGLELSLENAKGSTRKGVDKNGKPWASKMVWDYGYVRGSEGADGDHIDLFIGPDHESDVIFVVNQTDPSTKKFDELKCLLGFDSLAAAREGYLAHYPDGWKGLGSIVPMSVPGFKKLIADGGQHPVDYHFHEKAASLDYAPFAIKPSKIEGDGLHANKAFKAGEIIVPDFMTRSFSPARKVLYDLSREARFTNHKHKANTKVERGGDKVSLIADQDINPGDELTASYLDTAVYLGPRFDYTYGGQPYWGGSSTGKQTMSEEEMKAA